VGTVERLQQGLPVEVQVARIVFEEQTGIRRPHEVVDRCIRLESLEGAGLDPRVR